MKQLFHRKKGPVLPQREFKVFASHGSSDYATNEIRTSKYTYANFVPRNLFVQFHRVSNHYFLIISILQFFPVVSTVSPTTWLPLLVVLLTNLVKEFIEFRSRHKEDTAANNRPVVVVDRTSLKLSTIPSKDLKVSDVVLIKEDQPLPADIILVATSETDSGLLYIETKELDGETNVKNRQAVEVTQRSFAGSSDANITRQAFDFLGSLTVTCENPNENLNSFTGKLHSTSTSAIITNNEVAYRGCTCRMTKWAYGIVVFTGMETKVQKNAVEPQHKRTTIDRSVNIYLIFIFIFLILLCIISGIISGIWINKHTSPVPYYIVIPKDDKISGSAWKSTFRDMVTYLILLSTLIPISLTVSMELVKLFHARFVNWDEEMIFVDPDTKLKTPAKARTSNLGEDLGRIQYIFSDKTGTLTQNIMEFMKCSIRGVTYGTGMTEIGMAAAMREGRSIQQDQRPPDLKLRRGDNFFDKRISLGSWTNSNDREHIEKFFTYLALCHTVMPKHKDPSKYDPSNVTYQASSPDELALVLGAAGSGFALKNRIYTNVTIAIDGIGDKVFEVLATNEFNSTRKRMSTVVRMPDKRLLLIVKGADSVVYERLNPTSNPHRDVMKDHLKHFANEGLRTLCIAERDISEHEFTAWESKFREASTSRDKDQALDEVASEIEKNLTLVGATAIEDKLQVGVPNCIKLMKEAGIQVWVLTGDKVETAINIAMACNLLNIDMHLEKITLPDPSESDNDSSRLTAVRTMLANATSNASSHNHRSIGLVIDGYSLEYALTLEKGAKELGELLQLSEKCLSVVCCRVTPLQKAEVVTIVREKRKVITLAIGDGANDVGMILRAHIGVGIIGKEGTAAVQNSDYAIGQFRYLQQLVLLHGRWSFERIALLVKFFFYKNTAFAPVFIWFSCFTGFSGVKFFDDYYSALWNVVFTSVPILLAAAFNKDFLYKSTLVSHANLYKKCQSGDSFTVVKFAMWFVEGLWVSLVSYFVPHLIFFESFHGNKGLDISKWMFTVGSTLCVASIVNLRLWIVTHTYNAIIIVFYVLSFAISFLFLWALCSLKLSHDRYWCFMNMLQMGGFWAAYFIALVLGLVPSLTYYTIVKLFFPDETERVRKIEQREISHLRQVNRDLGEQEWYDVLELEKQKSSMMNSDGMRNPPSPASELRGFGDVYNETGYAFSAAPGGDPEVTHNYHH